MDGITLTDMGGGWVLLPCDQIGANATWTKNGQKMDKNDKKWTENEGNFKIIEIFGMHYHYSTSVCPRRFEETISLIPELWFILYPAAHRAYLLTQEEMDVIINT